MIRQLKDIGLAVIAATPLLLPFALPAAAELISPGKIVQYRDIDYRVEKDAKETRVYYGNIITMTEMADNKNDGSIDTKISMTCVPRRGCIRAHHDITNDDRKLYAGILDIMNPESNTHYYTRP